MAEDVLELGFVMDVNVEAEKPRRLCVGVVAQLAVESGLPRRGRELDFIDFRLRVVQAHFPSGHLHVHAVEERKELLSG
jgi:hypothetical protein